MSPRLTGSGFSMGMALGQAQSEHKKNQAYIADRERAAREAEEDRALDEQDRQASADIADLQLQEMGAEEQEGVPGAAPFGVGPETQATVDRKKVMAERLAFTRARVAKMQPENRQRFLEEEHARMRQQVNDRARQRLAGDIQDRIQHGGYNFLEEEEPDPAILERVEALTKALDDETVDPLKVAEVDAKILEVVRTENQKRLARNRTTAMIDDRVAKSVQGGNHQLSKDLEALRAMWGTGEMDADDLVDKLFELETGRKTARAAGPTQFEIRKEALKLWQAANEGATEPPTEEDLAQFMALLDPPEPPPVPSREQVIEGAGRANARGADNLPTGVSQETTEEGPRSAPTKAGLKDIRRPKKGSAEEGGRGPQAWAKLKPAERSTIEKDMLAAAKDHQDPATFFRTFGVKEIPEALFKKLEDAYYGAPGPKVKEAGPHTGIHEAVGMAHRQKAKKAKDR